jgi:glycosyltransferase involved in cell wall biosynthesis
MRILLCCEFYFPSIGGVQVVMQQLAERFAEMGHQVTVATSRIPERTKTEINGVLIKEFTVSGNQASGMSGEISAYQEYVSSGAFDVVMIKAAQQWTFDALWPVLGRLTAAKVFIPCGFSGLYEPAYRDYFTNMPDILQKFDKLIFYASDYRDINFAREHGIENFIILPNGASEREFYVERDPAFRTSHGIGNNDLLFLTVGSMNGLKGHLEIAKAFDLANFGTQHATLILNGNKCKQFHKGLLQAARKIVGVLRLYGPKYVAKHLLKTSLRGMGIRVGKDDEFEATLISINRHPQKRVIVTDLPRQELVQAFIAADLFVFASNVEYSPLVLFEAAAAGTPFLSVPVGNSAEIAEWTGAGVICPAECDAKGYTRVDPLVFAQAMEEMMRNRNRLRELGTTGRRNWQEQFTWAVIAQRYEALFRSLVAEKVE